jgi:hypothetical protein
MVALGSSKANLTTVGYLLYDVEGNPSGSRITAGVENLSGGQFAALVTIPDDFRGYIKWDSGEGSPVYASDPINPEEGENNLSQDGLVSLIWSAVLSGYGPTTAGGILNRLSGGRFSLLNNPVSEDGVVLTLVRATDYLAKDGKDVSWTDAANLWPELTSASIRFQAVITAPGPNQRNAVINATGRVITATGQDKSVSIDIPSSATNVVAGSGTYNVIATLSSGSQVELVRGILKLLPSP